MPTFYADSKESVSVVVKMEVARAVQEAARVAKPGPDTTWEEIATNFPDRAEVTKWVADRLKSYPDVPDERAKAGSVKPIAMKEPGPAPVAASSSSGSEGGASKSSSSTPSRTSSDSEDKPRRRCSGS